MPHLELHLATTDDNAEQLSTFLTLLGAQAITYCDAKGNPIYEPLPGQTHLWRNLWIIGLFPENVPIDKIIAFLKREAPAAIENIKVELINDADWTNKWLEHYKPMRFGKTRHFWVCPPEQDINHSNELKMFLKPGLAFGTGTHATTALCLDWLTDNVKENDVLIDYGCGSGILAIAAVILGAKKVYAIDIDSQALIATKDNAKLNKISKEKLIVLSADEANNLESADIVIANILANPLTELAATLTAYLKPKGKIGLSGIFAQQEPEIKSAYQTYVDFDNSYYRDEWALVTGQKM